MRGAKEIEGSTSGGQRFQSTLPMRGATASASSDAWVCRFQSTLPMRGAKTGGALSPTPIYFNPRSPCGERWWQMIFFGFIFISIHAPHAGSDCGGPVWLFASGISIHAPHAGSDRHGKKIYFCGRISIHAPHAGSDRRFLSSVPPSSFQSTLPMRGAIGPCFLCRTSSRFQSTLPMRGATFLERVKHRTGRFQSTLPMRGATGYNIQSLDVKNFNPRSPCGERPISYEEAKKWAISIHAPHAGSDMPPYYVLAYIIFQSTLPMRGAMD